VTATRSLLDAAGERAQSTVERLGSATDRDLELASSDARAVSGLAMRELGRREGRREADAAFAELREFARWPEFVFVVAPVGVISNIMADPKTGTMFWVEGEGGHTHVIPESLAKASPLEIAAKLGVEAKVESHLRVTVAILRGGEAVAGEWLNMTAVIAPRSLGLTNSLGRLAGQLLEAARALGRQHGVFPPPDLDQIISGAVQTINANKERIAAMPVDDDAIAWMLSGAGTVIEHDEQRGVSVSVAAAEQAASDTRRDGMTRLVLIDSGARKIEITALRPARPRPTGRLAEAPVDPGPPTWMQERHELQADNARLEARIVELVGQLESQAHERLTDDARKPTDDRTLYTVRAGDGYWLRSLGGWSPSFGDSMLTDSESAEMSARDNAHRQAQVVPVLLTPLLGTAGEPTFELTDLREAFDRLSSATIKFVGMSDDTADSLCSVDLAGELAAMLERREIPALLGPWQRSFVKNRFDWPRHAVESPTAWVLYMPDGSVIAQAMPPSARQEESADMVERIARARRVD
jgi:hypothetical protein